MTDKPDAKRNEAGLGSIQVEQNGMVFTVDAPPIYADRQWTGKFASIVSKDKGGCPLFEVMENGQLASFDTEEEAIAAGRAFLFAKLSERPSLWQRIAYFAAAFMGLILFLIVGLIATLLGAVQALKRRLR